MKEKKALYTVLQHDKFLIRFKNLIIHINYPIKIKIF